MPGKIRSTLALVALCMLISFVSRPCSAAEDGKAIEEVGKSSEVFPYSFNDDQKSRLAKAEASFDYGEREVAIQMKKRGFSAEQYVDAFESAAKISVSDKGEVSKIATFKALGYSIEDYREANSWEYGATDYYNYNIGGNGMRIAGWVLFGIGVANLAGGGILLAMGDPCDDTDSCWSNYDEVMIASFVVGGLGVLIGTPLAIVGTMRVNSWVPGSSLDNASVDELRKYNPYAGKSKDQDGDAKGDEVAFAFAPSLGPKVCGLSFLMQF